MADDSSRRGWELGAGSWQRRRAAGAWLAGAALKQRAAAVAAVAMAKRDGQAASPAAGAAGGAHNWAILERRTHGAYTPLEGRLTRQRQDACCQAAQQCSPLCPWATR
ncbi:hypothetical protein FA09DRAFT_332278 [Tilletiopsis washingtonensis]|uniref:Uncharacterized protein n=1 Tax=Tilletiopsis washingtonensis TaxID=58919 RepID=A0A316Z4G6_9BASI|nr:hypothetical protein FA09DRAFT_332278 [Tilletiopsis washingtonensis]PWN95095.1 hypothetical protein FA09DRAFT_332278 [Tilletiopsis washingtonensis]